MKLKTKLILSFSVVIVLIGGIGITSTYINESVKDQVTAESEQAIDEVELAGELALQLYQSLTRTQYLLEDQYRQSLSMNYSRGNKSRETLINNIEVSLQKFRRNLDNIRALIKKDPEDIFQDTTTSKEVPGLLNKLEKKFSIYSSLLKQFQELSEESYQDGKEFFTVTIEPYFRTNLLPLIEQVRKEIQSNHEEEIASLNTELARVGYILGFATMLALVTAISLTFFLYRSIANPIQKITTAAKSIGRGNLEERIDYNSKDELGQLSEAFDTMAENLSRTTVSRDYVDSIIEAMADLLIVTDTDYRISRVNSAGMEMLGSSEEELLMEPASEIFTNPSKPIVGEGSTENIKSCNAEITLKEGESIPVSVSKGTIKNAEGDIQGYVIVASDISTEKEAQKKIAQSLKEKEVMLAEIHHRVKNNLAVITGLLQMQIWEADSEDAASVLKQSQLRVRSIALVHEKLYQSETLSHIEFDTYIQELIEAISDMYIRTSSDIQIDTELAPLILNINQAIPCSLLINELIINAFKYAFNDGKGGTIKVSLRKKDQRVTLQVQDNGKGLKKEDMDSGSLGLTLVKTLTKQLNGDLQIKNSNGAHVIVEFTAEEVLPS